MPRIILSFLIAAAVETAAHAAPKCEEGKIVTSDTLGHCCYRGQGYNGTPTQCPSGFSADPEKETCSPLGCDAGREHPANNQAACCWPGQAWSSDRGVCVGKPSCPAGRDAEREDCVLSAGTAPPLAPPESPTAIASPSADAEANLLAALTQRARTIGPLGSVAPDGAYRIAFRGPEGASFFVTSLGKRVCDLPCSMWALSFASLAVGSPDTKRPLTLSTRSFPHGASLLVTVEHNDRGLLAAGSVATVVGGVGIGVGIWGIVETVRAKNQGDFIIAADLGTILGTLSTTFGALLLATGAHDQLSVQARPVLRERNEPTLSFSPFGAIVTF